MSQPTVRNIVSVLLLAAIIGAGAMITFFVDFDMHLQSPEGSGRQRGKLTGAEAQHRIEEANRKIREITRAYTERQNDSSAQVSREIATLIEEAKAQAATRARTDTEKFRGYSNASMCAYLATKDDLFGTSEFQAYAKDAMAPTFKLLAQIHSAIDEKLCGYRHEVEALANQHQQETLVFKSDLESLGVAMKAPDFSAIRKSVSSRIQTVPNNVWAPTGALALEAVMVKSTLASIRRIIGFIVARETAALTVGGGAAVADGPFPAGDVIGVSIAVAGTGKSAWDLYWAAKELESLPSEVEASILTEIKQMSEGAAASVTACDHAASTYFQEASEPPLFQR